MENKMNTDLAVLYLTNKANAEEIEIFTAWLSASTGNLEYYKNWAECWQTTGQTYQDLDVNINKVWNFVRRNTVDKQVEKNNQRNLKLAIVRIAATVTLLIGLTGMAYWLHTTGDIRHETLLTYSSGFDTLNVRLSDGTNICLNKNTILKAPKVFKKRVRRVFLEGEAFFNVARDTEKPFKIFAGNSVTEVLGTSFNLKAKPSDSFVKLSLIEGKVAFYKNNIENEKLILLPFQQVTYSNISETFMKDTFTNMNVLAWKTKKLQFKNTSLTELCNVLSDYYKINMVCTEMNSPSKSPLFTGNFNNLPLEDVLNILEKTLNINIGRLENRIEIFYK